MATIAWIEDDVNIIETLLFPLERKGHSIKKFGSVGEAIGAIDQLRHADVIVVDMLLPPGTFTGPCGPYPGVDLLKHLTQSEKIQVPILVLSVVKSEQVLDQVRCLGILDILRKPVLPSTLELRIEAIVGRTGAGSATA